ncbi:MAG: hypothetical protein M1491_03125 [Deltaproteobacteria bacterium]|nr:hypothetical protein [Deltaproteobacteria bacterium]
MKVTCLKGYDVITLSDEGMCPIVGKIVPGGCLKCDAPVKENKKGINTFKGAVVSKGKFYKP